MCGPNFILEKPFRLFDFTLDSSSINRTRTWTRGIRTRTRSRTRDLHLWWTRTRTWTRSLRTRTRTRESGNSPNTG